MHYLDNAATSRVMKEAADTAYRLMRDDFGNPSSLHSAGLAAYRELLAARAGVAALCGADKNEITFTSGGTEAINTAVFGAARRKKHLGRHILSAETEHHAALNAMKSLLSQGFELTLLRPGSDGVITPDMVLPALREDTILLSLAMVNNETGALLPAAEIRRALSDKGSGALFHIDAVQALYKIRLDLRSLGVDLASFSGHKIGAPKGVGALFIRKGLKIPSLLFGGGQEAGMRSGTEALPSIAAFGEACRIRLQNLKEDLETVGKLNDYLHKRLLDDIPDVQQNGASGVPHITNFTIPGTKSEVVMRILDMRGVCVSPGSACARGKRSHVLSSMGLPAKRIDGALRISLSPENTRGDIDALIDGLIEARRRTGRGE